MKNSYDKEYAPIIENYIADYTDGTLDPVEGAAFEEVLVYDDDLRQLAHSARLGKTLLKQLRQMKARKGFEQRLMERIQSEN